MKRVAPARVSVPLFCSESPYWDAAAAAAVAAAWLGLRALYRLDHWTVKETEEEEEEEEENRGGGVSHVEERERERNREWMDSSSPMALHRRSFIYLSLSDESMPSADSSGARSV